LTNYHAPEVWLNWIDELSDRNFVIIDDFIKEADYQIIRQFFLARLDDLSTAGIGPGQQNQVNRNIRGDETLWLDPQRDTELRSFWELIDESVAVLNRYCYLSLSGFEFHLTRYAPGSHYARHLDQFNSRSNRMISMVIYLNENWQPGDGGELELDDTQGNRHLVAPIKNRCALFKSADVPHAVLQAHKDRYSLTGWLLYRPAELGSIFG
jgi:SM-20-related protein